MVFFIREGNAEKQTGHCNRCLILPVAPGILVRSLVTTINTVTVMATINTVNGLLLGGYFFVL